MQLPPLPLIDNCLFIDNSSWMEGMNSCYRYLEYRSLRLRVPSAEKPSLNFGSAIHLCLEHRYLNHAHNPVDDKYYNDIGQILTDFYADHPVPADDWRTMIWAMEVMRRYNGKYDVEPFQLLVDKDGKPLVELSFGLPLAVYDTESGILRPWTGVASPHEIKIVYSGKIDLPIVQEGNIYIMDHKTTSMLGNMFWDEMRMSSQQRGYVWSFEQLTGKRLHGYYINAIRTKVPPQYVLDGKPSRSGKALTPESWWNESLQRERFLLQPGEGQAWLANTLDLIDEFFFHYRRGYMPQKTKWCAFYGRCPYYEVCQLHPDDRLFLLQSGQFVDNTWSPLKQNNKTQSNENSNKIQS